MQDKFKQEPQTWYIRRANHLGKLPNLWCLLAGTLLLTCCFAAAFEVDNAEAMEHRLQHFGIEYTRAIVPGTEAVQLFFYDLHGYVQVQFLQRWSVGHIEYTAGFTLKSVYAEMEWRWDQTTAK